MRSRIFSRTSSRVRFPLLFFLQLLIQLIEVLCLLTGLLRRFDILGRQGAYSLNHSFPFSIRPDQGVTKGSAKGSEPRGQSTSLHASWYSDPFKCHSTLTLLL